jgi:quinol monooxygenase YgiN
MLTLLAKAKTKPEQMEAFERELHSLVEPTRSEEGCLSYNFHRSADQENVFVFYEVWKDKDALEKHMAMPYLAKFWSERLEYLDVDVEIEFLEMLSPFPT